MNSFIVYILNARQASLLEFLGRLQLNKVFHLRKAHRTKSNVQVVNDISDHKLSIKRSPTS